MSLNTADLIWVWNIFEFIAPFCLLFSRVVLATAWLKCILCWLWQRWVWHPVPQSSLIPIVCAARSTPLHLLLKFRMISLTHANTQTHLPRSTYAACNCLGRQIHWNITETKETTRRQNHNALAKQPLSMYCSNVLRITSGTEEFQPWTVDQECVAAVPDKSSSQSRTHLPGALKWPCKAGSKITDGLNGNWS